jgi:carboxypeptidase D
MRHLDQIAQRCGYSDYMEKYLKYPPADQLPFPKGSPVPSDGCDVWTTVFEAALLVNPAFNMYRIFDGVGPNPPTHSFYQLLYRAAITLF